MPISQTEGYLSRTYALLAGFKMTPKKKRFRVLRQKQTQILPQNLLKGANIHFYCLFDESHFSNILLF